MFQKRVKGRESFQVPLTFLRRSVGISDSHFSRFRFSISMKLKLKIKNGVSNLHFPVITSTKIHPTKSVVVQP